MYYILLVVVMCNAYYDYTYLDYNSLSSEFLRQKATTKPTTARTKKIREHWKNFNETFFMSLPNYQTGANYVEESDYPWIGKVVHSRTNDYPIMCTTACIEERIFITSARCIYNLKVDYTTIHYSQIKLPVLSFVLPTNMTRQAYDDIGLIVVERVDVKGPWATIHVFDEWHREDDYFHWFDEWVGGSNDDDDFTVVAYAPKKGKHQLGLKKTVYELVALHGIINLGMCPQILMNTTERGFFVPCYHSCRPRQFYAYNSSCDQYIGVDGAAIVDHRSKALLGVATWGTTPLGTRSHDLPVGFAIPNSERFKVDHVCAQRIRNDTATSIHIGYYQSLCPETSNEIEDPYF